MDRHAFKGTWAWVLSAGVLLMPGVLCGQEALQNAVQGDKTYRQRIAPRRNADQYHKIGAIDYFTTVSYGVEWRDNVLSSETAPQSDFIHRPRVDLHAVWNATRTSRLNFGFGAGYTKYTRLRGQDRFNIAPNSELAWDVPAKDFLFTFYDRFSYTEEVTSQGAITGVAAFPRMDNTVGLRVTWNPSRWVVQTGYGHQNFLSSSALFSYLNRSTENFFQRVAYKLAPQTLVGLEATESITAHTQPIQNDNSSLSTGPYVSWQLTRALALNLRGGYVRYAFDSLPGQGPVEGFSSYYFGAEVEHDLTDTVRQSLSADRRVQQGQNRGGQYIQTTEVRYDVTWRFNRHGRLIGDAIFEDGLEPQLGRVEEYIRWGGGIGLNYELVKHFAPTLRYAYTQRDSNLTGRSYTANTVSLSLTYRF